MKTDARSRFRGLRAVPLGRTEYVVRLEFPSRIVGIYLELGMVPFDVGIGVEMLHHRLATESANQIEVCVVLVGLAGAFFFGNNKFFARYILQNFLSQVTDS